MGKAMSLYSCRKWPIFFCFWGVKKSSDSFKPVRFEMGAHFFGIDFHPNKRREKITKLFWIKCRSRIMWFSSHFPFYSKIMDSQGMLTGESSKCLNERARETERERRSWNSMGKWPMACSFFSILGRIYIIKYVKLIDYPVERMRVWWAKKRDERAREKGGTNDRTRRWRAASTKRSDECMALKCMHKVVDIRRTMIHKRGL